MPANNALHYPRRLPKYRGHGPLLRALMGISVKLGLSVFIQSNPCHPCAVFNYKQSNISLSLPGERGIILIA
jgi:hypothetical protein